MPLPLIEDEHVRLLACLEDMSAQVRRDFIVKRQRIIFRHLQIGGPERPAVAARHGDDLGRLGRKVEELGRHRKQVGRAVAVEIGVGQRIGHDMCGQSTSHSSKEPIRRGQK